MMNTYKLCRMAGIAFVATTLSGVHIYAGTPALQALWRFDTPFTHSRNMCSISDLASDQWHIDLWWPTLDDPDLPVTFNGHSAHGIAYWYDHPAGVNGLTITALVRVDGVYRQPGALLCRPNS